MPEIPDSQEIPEPPHIPDPINNMEIIIDSYNSPLKLPKKRIRTVTDNDYKPGTEFPIPIKAGVKFIVNYFKSYREYIVSLN
jgi:hypothetical protein